jgi:virginiamycin A acetyltransferase
MKRLLKFTANGIATAIVLPAIAGYALGGLLLGRVKAFEGWSQAMSLLPGLSGAYLRRAFYRGCLVKCAPDVQITFGTTLARPGSQLGRGVYLGSFCSLGLVTLEDDVLVGSHVSILSGCRQHGIEQVEIPVRKQAGVTEHITIGEGTWIGERSVVMANIGRHCVIGAGSVVTQAIPDFSVAVGVPARVLKSRVDRSTLMTTYGAA